MAILTAIAIAQTYALSIVYSSAPILEIEFRGY